MFGSWFEGTVQYWGRQGGLGRKGRVTQHLQPGADAGRAPLALPTVIVTAHSGTPLPGKQAWGV